MTYLISPVLQECGMFDIARDIYMKVLKFHSMADGETAEMIAHCFKYGNYMKSLELQKFSRKCEKSLSLAIACTELPLLDFICDDNLYNIIEIKTYLINYIGGLLVLPSPHRISIDNNNNNNNNNFNDNSDYSLLIRCDIDNQTIYNNNKSHKDDSILRISITQKLIDITYSFCVIEYDKIIQYLIELDIFGLLNVGLPTE